MEWLDGPERHRSRSRAPAARHGPPQGGIALAAVGVLLWRFGHPTPPRMATAYIAGATLIVGASVLIWQLVHIPAAAIAFHAGEFTLLIAAWRDRDGVRAIRHGSA